MTKKYWRLFWAPVTLALVLSIATQAHAAVPLDLYKYIEVDISDQKLYAYEYGQLVRSFLISTGVRKRPTPLGDFSVLEKVPQVTYKWSYGANHLDNYDLGTVPYNLRFKKYYYIHYSPWHSNFGKRMSHGCVNVDKANAKWIYEWADKDVAINVHI